MARSMGWVDVIPFSEREKVRILLNKNALRWIKLWMKTMQDTVRRALGAAFLMGCFVQLAQGQELTRELVAQLAATAVEVRVKEVTVGPMLDVDQTLADGVVATKGKCVIFIAPRQIDGSRRRSIFYRTFFHDANWGWYLYAEKTVRGGDAIQIVSEHMGIVELK